MASSSVLARIPRSAVLQRHGSATGLYLHKRRTPSSAFLQNQISTLPARLGGRRLRVFRRAGTPPPARGTALCALAVKEKPKSVAQRSKYTIATLPGDGQGPEVMQVAKQVLSALGSAAGVEFELVDGLIGNAALAATGSPMPPATCQLCQRADAVLLGGISSVVSVPGPDFPLGSPLRPRVALSLRESLGLFWQLSPACAFPQLENDYPLKPWAIRNTDIMIVREISAGMYVGKQNRDLLPSGERRAQSTSEYTALQIERIARAAFEIARQRSRRLTSVDLANYLEVSKLWREVMLEVSREYPDVELTNELADRFSTTLVQKPSRYDVVVMANLLGDVLVEAARGLTGGVRFSPAAELGGPGRPGVFGFSGELGGKPGRSNPFGLVRSVSMMLRYQLDLPVLGDLVQQALKAVLADGIRTADMGVVPENTVLPTEEVGVRLVEAMEYFQSFKVAGNPAEVGE